MQPQSKTFKDYPTGGSHKSRRNHSSSFASHSNHAAHENQPPKQATLAEKQQQRVKELCQAAQKNVIAMELLGKGKTEFKENNIEGARKCFQDALKEEPMLLES